jgi:diguanylate cyclase (GGDEF)-like protein
MNVIDWLQKPAKTGIEGAISEIVKLVLLALVGAVFNYLLAHFPGLSGSFWAARRFAVYQLAIWLCVTAVASVWITYSVMQRQMRRIESEAKELSRTDPATGLLNLRALNEQFPEAMEQARRTKQPLTLVIFDIDAFKDVNTLLGHEFGHVILKRVAALLSPRAPDQVFRYPENVEPRSKRVVYRYGGDEFLILAFNTTVDGGTDPATGKPVSNGTVMVERLLENVWNMNYSPLAEARKKRGQPTKLTVSAGISDTNPSLDPKDTVAKLTHRAELALNEAKRLNVQDTHRDESFKGRALPWTPNL